MKAWDISESAGDGQRRNRELPLPEFRYFPKGDVERLARAMLDLFKRGISPEERLRYLDLLRQEYNWDRIAERTLRVYREVLL